MLGDNIKKAIAKLMQSAEEGFDAHLQSLHPNVD